jgi:hypothetical protein
MKLDPEQERLLAGLERGYRLLMRLIEDQPTRSMPHEDTNSAVRTWCEILRTMQALGIRSDRDDDGGRGPGPDEIGPAGRPDGIADKGLRGVGIARRSVERPRIQVSETEEGLEY